MIFSSVTTKSYLSTSSTKESLVKLPNNTGVLFDSKQEKKNTEKNALFSVQIAIFLSSAFESSELTAKSKYLKSK